MHLEGAEVLLTRYHVTAQVQLVKATERDDVQVTEVFTLYLQGKWSCMRDLFQFFFFLKKNATDDGT